VNTLLSNIIFPYFYCSFWCVTLSFTNYCKFSKILTDFPICQKTNKTWIWYSDNQISVVQAPYAASKNPTTILCIYFNKEMKHYFLCSKKYLCSLLSFLSNKCFTHVSVLVFSTLCLLHYKRWCFWINNFPYRTLKYNNSKYSWNEWTDDDQPNSEYVHPRDITKNTNFCCKWFQISIMYRSNCALSPLTRGDKHSAVPILLLWLLWSVCYIYELLMQCFRRLHGCTDHKRDYYICTVMPTMQCQLQHISSRAQCAWTRCISAL